MNPRGRNAAKAPASGGYRQLLRWAALPVTDRRWAAPLCAIALGFGLFAGVAIGPGAAGTLATGASQVIEIPGFGKGASSGGDAGDEGAGSSATVASSAAGSSGSGGSAGSEESSSLPSFAPVVESEPASEGESTEASEGPTPKAEPPSSEESSEPEEEVLSGIVVHVNPAAGSYVLVEPGGVLDAIHAAKAPRPGTKVSVPVRPLANGTFAEASTRKKAGVRSRVTFSGVVTYVDPTPSAPAYTVSKRGASVLVHVHPDPAGAAPALPVLGAFAKVAVDIEKPQPPVTSPTPPVPAPTAAPVATAGEAPPPPATVPGTEAPPVAQPGCAPDPTQSPLPAFKPAAILWQRQISAEGAPFTYGDFAGIVEAVCPGSSQLSISADDFREGAHDLLFTVPATIDTAKLEIGQSVLATATIGVDGSLSLTGLASDERTKGADDAKSAFGDLAPVEAK